jgi:hypothetical protein
MTQSERPPRSYLGRWGAIFASAGVAVVVVPVVVVGLIVGLWLEIYGPVRI